MGKDAEGHITRAPFALDMADKKPMIKPINELFKKMKDNPGGREISDVPARAFTGFIVLADAINRALAGDHAMAYVRSTLAAGGALAAATPRPIHSVRSQGGTGAGNGG